MNEHDERIRRLTADYNQPSEADAAQRDALWERIQAARAEERLVRHAPRPEPRAWKWIPSMVAVAAVLLVGIMIGRWSMPESGVGTPTDAPVVAETSPEEPSVAHRLYTRDVLLRTETLLTEFRLAAVSPEAPMNGTTSPWASGLLLETRLLIDSPVSTDPKLDQLLRELELILAEIVQLTDTADERERREIRQSLEDRGVMLRLRNAVPAKVGTRGA